MLTPVFIIQIGRRYFVTTTLLEYDPDNTGGDPAKISGVNLIKATFDGCADKPAARNVTRLMGSIRAAQTGTRR